MIGLLLGPLQAVARRILQRAALLWAAAVIGTVGCGFVLIAAYAGLWLLIGPVWGALAIGLVLLAVAGGLVAAAHKRVQAPVAQAAPHDPVKMAVFTAAFVLGRYLARRGRD